MPTGTTDSSGTGASPDAASFGDLDAVCGPGNGATASDRGVTASEIDVSTFSDVGFTKVNEFPDAATVFTDWCNAAGGINGRKIVSHTRDSRLTEDRQRMIEACKTDFAVVGGGAAFDQSGVKDRLKCLMPEFPGQVVSSQNAGSDLQVLSNVYGNTTSGYEGYFDWLMSEAYPNSKASIGIISGDAAVTKTISVHISEVLGDLGATVSYNDLYPATGVSDWTPYAEAIKSGNVKGLVFLGAYPDLAKLEQSLTDIGYAPDWIDANSNAYNQEFLSLAKPVLGTQNNLAALNVHPLEEAGTNPATQQLLDLYEQYLPDAHLTLPSIQAFSAWLLFAVSARDCGDALTRKCVYENGIKHTSWTGGGLTAEADPSALGTSTKVCWDAVQATPAGWVLADNKPDTGIYRRTTNQHPYTKDVAKPTTLADVGLSLDDLP
ncbi:MAG: transporter substrate-binding protein [Ilumatobacteraceae bacterium]|nr:transporter substrate-binding protein [Ilumatobacteraceae bacterium]